MVPVGTEASTGGTGAAPYAERTVAAVRGSRPARAGYATRTWGAGAGRDARTTDVGRRARS
jgi:hypothetical protein